ncbi:hypothetical protein J6590_012292 [Homalodisca vitripennis]|nr:hypothetical protein J6590_012292 [Homalodisca vitripennis]
MRNLRRKTDLQVSIRKVKRVKTHPFIAICVQNRSAYLSHSPFPFHGWNNGTVNILVVTIIAGNSQMGPLSITKDLLRLPTGSWIPRPKMWVPRTQAFVTGGHATLV